MKLIIEYKDILNNNKNDYYSLLLSSIVIQSAASAPNCQSTDVIYPSFLISLEVIKKRLECEKNEYVYDDNNVLQTTKKATRPASSIRTIAAHATSMPSFPRKWASRFPVRSSSCPDWSCRPSTKTAMSRASSRSIRPSPRPSSSKSIQKRTFCRAIRISFTALSRSNGIWSKAFRTQRIRTLTTTNRH